MKRGYTLIELMITMTISLTLIVFGLSSYRQMQSSQTVASAQGSVMNTLTSAQKRASIGDKDCTGPFLGIKVVASSGTGTMSTQALCQGNSGALASVSIPSAAFTANTTATFQPLAQGVDLGGAVSQNLDYIIAGATYRIQLARNGNITYLGKQ